MRRRQAATRHVRSAAALAGAGLVLAGAACGGGSTSPITGSTGVRDDPGTTRDPAPSGRDDPGGGTNGACLQCDVTYACFLGTAQTPETITLSTGGGTCTPANIAFICSGALFGGIPCVAEGESFVCGQIRCAAGVQGLPGVGSGGGVPGSGSSSGSSGG
jgi:hypothetical protein